MELPRVTGRALIAPSARPLAAVAGVAGLVVVAGLGDWLAHRTRAVGIDIRADAWIDARFGRYDHLLAIAHFLGDPQGAVIMSVVLVLACLLIRGYRGAILVAVAVPLGGGLTELALKPLINRTIWGHVTFPSGHVTGSAAIAAAAVLILTGPSRPPLPGAARGLLAALAAGMVTAVALAMIALHLHQFTDVVGGAAVGVATTAATALAVDALAPRLTRRHRAESAGRRGGWPGYDARTHDHDHAR